MLCAVRAQAVAGRDRPPAVKQRTNEWRKMTVQMLQPDWTVPTHTRRDSYWRQAVTTCVITFLNANGLLSTDKEVVSLVQKSTFSCMMTVKAPSPCHWRCRFQACGVARRRQGCWTAWRRAAQWNKVQTAGNGANQSMWKALRCTRCSFFRRPWPRRSFSARWLCPPPPLFCTRQTEHTQQKQSEFTLRTDVVSRQDTEWQV